MACHYDGFIMVRGGGYHLLSSSLIVLKPPTDMYNTKVTVGNRLNMCRLNVVQTC